jgi:hypothetical protein
MRNYIEDLQKERENDIEQVMTIMNGVSTYFVKRILNDALEAYKLYLEDEIASNKETIAELYRKG